LAASFFTRTPAAGVLLALALVPLVSAQKQPVCDLAGTVVNSATNAGIAHAMVVVNGAANGYRFTDSGGNFQIAGVPCSGYSLTVTKPGFVSGEEQPQQLGNPLADLMNDDAAENRGKRAPEPVREMVNLTAGSARARIPLIPVASISGTVLDENGEPIGGVSVQAIAVKASLSGAEYVASETSQTDDRGRYNLLDLTPGDYLVRLAGETASTGYFVGALNLNNDHRGMTPLYYPNATSESAATVLTLAPAAKTTVDFQHPSEPAFDVNGQLSGFFPQAWTQLRLYRDGDRQPVGRAFVNITTGQFRLTDIPRGNYTLRVEQYQAEPPLSLAAEEPLTIAGQPIRDFIVSMARGVDIPVAVSYEEGAREDENGQIQIWLEPLHSRENFRQSVIGGKRTFIPDGAVQQGAPAPDAATTQPRLFSNVLPDRYKLIVQSFQGENYLASVKLGDLEVLHGEFPIGSEPGELHVTVRGDSASVEGQVTFQSKPALGAQIYLVPASGDSTGTKFGFGGPEGHYEIKGVPPGDYRIHAWIGAPSTKEQMSDPGQSITLQPREKQTVAIEASAGENAVHLLP
jgi:hypothetical protein